MTGKVSLVGAGPGDPELLTLRAARLLQEADVVAYDELVSQELFALCPRAERIPVGRRACGVRHHEGRIHPLVLERAREGKHVVRLKGGDPFVFGRGGEEAEELAEAGIPFEIVPGVSAAFGAAASLALPLTLRGVSTSLTLVTAHRMGDEPMTPIAPGGTVVFYMGATRLVETTAMLVASGWAPSTPACVIARATRPEQETVFGTLATIADDADAAGLATPALFVVGEVVARCVEQPVHARRIARLSVSARRAGRL